MHPNEKQSWKKTTVEEKQGRAFDLSDGVLRDTDDIKSALIDSAKKQESMEEVPVDKWNKITEFNFAVVFVVCDNDGVMKE